MQIRSGRFGQAPAGQQTQQVQALTPEDIRDEPITPQGRFGRSLKSTEALREKATALKQVRGEAIQEAERLESEFFGQKITIRQAEEGYAQVDPFVKQFIRTTPEVRRQLAQQVLSNIDSRIANEQATIDRLSQTGGSNSEIEILERQQLITELNDLRDEAAEGALTYEDLVGYAESRAAARGARAKGRIEFETGLAQSGVPQSIAKRIIKGRGKAKITSEEAQALSPEARMFLGINEKDFQTTNETRALTEQELIEKGVPRSVAAKLSSGQNIDLEEFYSLPKNFREQSGLTRKDFEGDPETIVEKISAVQALKTRISQASTFRERAIFRTPLVVPLYAEALFEDLATKAGEVAVKKGFDVGQLFTTAGLPANIQIRFGEQATQKAVQLGVDVATFSIPIVREVRTVTFSSSVAGKLAAGDKVILGLTPKEKEISILEVAAAGFAAGGLAKSFLSKEVIVFKERPKDVNLKALTEIINVKQLEKEIDIAKFSVVGTKEGRFAYVATRGSIFRSNLLGLDTPLESLTAAQLKFPSGRVIQIERASLAITNVEPFLTKGGKVLRPAFRDANAVAFVSAKGTEKSVRGLTIGRFEGDLDKEIKKLRLVRKKNLSVMDRSLLGEVEKKLVFKKEADFFTGNVITKDVLKINKKGNIINLLGIEKVARSVRRGRFAGVQEDVALVQFNRPFGVKQIEQLEERVAFADVTFPRLPKTVKIGSSRKFTKDIDLPPRRIDILRGTTIRKEIELESPSLPSSDFMFKKFDKPNRFRLPQEEKFQQLLQKQDLGVSSKSLSLGSLKVGAALKTKTLLKSTTLSSKGINKLLSSSKQSFGSKVLSATSLGLIPKQTFRESTKNAQRLNTALLPRTSTRSITKLSAKLSPRESAKLQSKLSTKQTTKLTSRLTTKLTTRGFNNTTIKTPRLFIPRASPKSKGLPIFKFPKFKPLTISRRSKRRTRSDAYLSESFTARVLRLPAQKIRRSQIDKALRRQERDILSPRLRPIIIPDMMRRRKSRRKR